ncbi:hypothetical protein D3C77_561080 [compost metagenome]
MILIAWIASASVIGVAAVDTYASIACVNASKPVAAVSEGGIPIINSGSLIDNAGVTCLSTIAIFTLRAVSVMIVNFVTSLPVPAVVLIAIKGTIGFSDTSTPS